MKISKHTKQMMQFYSENNHINISKQTSRTDNIIRDFYSDIYEAYKYLEGIKKHKNYYTLTTRKIVGEQIPMPKYFNANSFPEIVRDHIKQFCKTELKFSFSLYERDIQLIFVLEEDVHRIDPETFRNYVDAIIMWLYILNIYASKQCANKMVNYFYFTSLEKNLPKTNISILSDIHVNTAFTRTCPKDSEIIVFRKEEWFKVFIHETFHNFALDFSDMYNGKVHNCILEVFKVRSDVNLYESYTEFWAEIMNALFCSFFSLKDKTNIDEFLSNSEFFINFERTHSFFQLVKTLRFMGLTYNDLYSETEHSKINRENLYKENTNVLAYYVIKTILINNYQEFLFWCKKNNFTTLQFKKTTGNQDEFCKFIKNNYNTKTMLNGIKEANLFLNKILSAEKRDKFKFVLNSLRMSICELG